MGEGRCITIKVLYKLIYLACDDCFVMLSVCYHPCFRPTTDAELQKALLILIEFFVGGFSFHFVMIDFIFNVLSVIHLRYLLSAALLHAVKYFKYNGCWFFTFTNSISIR